MTTAPAVWKEPANELKKFAMAIGMPDNKFEEGRDELSFFEENLGTEKFSTEAGQLRELEIAFAALKTKYDASAALKTKDDASLTFGFKVGDFELNHENYTPLRLKEFCEEIQGAPVRASLTINKKLLADHWGLTDASVDTRLFIFPDALEEALNRPLTKLEHGTDALLANFEGSKKLIIFVPDRNISLNGEYLAVIGGAAISNWKKYLPTVNPKDARAKINSVYAAATKPPRWDGINLQHLTPLQLSVNQEVLQNPTASSPDLITKRLYSHWLACSILYLATYCEETDSGAAVKSGAYDATFAQDKYLAVIRMDTTDEIGDTLTKTNSAGPWKAPILIGNLVNWAYQEKSGVAVRLKVLQEVVASLLQDIQPAERLPELVRKAVEVDKRVQSRWEGFLDDKLDKYFSDLKALEETVEATSKSYNEQVQSLTKTLTENILAAVGVIVGSFLAAIFASPFRQQVFLFGTITYLVYLVVFPVLIGLISAWQRYRDSHDAFTKRKQDLGNRMRDPVLVQKIVGDSVTRREGRFENWFYATVAIYGVVILLMLFAICTVPGIIQQWTDAFTLRETFYGKPLEGKTVPLTIRGANFDKDKEIVVQLGDASFTNAGQGSLKVHGSTVLTLSPTRTELQAALAKGPNKVRQGSSSEHSLQLPSRSLPESPDPVFESWNWLGQKDKRSLEATGSNFDSISEVTLDGTKREFHVSEDHRKITIRSLAANTKLGDVKVLLTDGRDKTVPIKLNR